MSKDDRHSLRAGAETADITPYGRVFLYGYPNVRRYSSGVHDPLQCAALYLASGGDAALFIANDLISIPNRLVQAVRQRIREQTGVAEDAILISATHTHSGPVMADHLSNADDPCVPKADAGYLGWLADSMVATAVKAVKSAVAVEVGLGLTRAEGVGTNRHDPAGPADPDVTVLLVRSLATQLPVACMMVYAMHPTVLHEDSTLISADFPHFTREFLHREALPATCPVIYHNGAAGNQSPRHVTRANTFAEAQRLGERLGQTVAAALPSLRFQSDLRIRCRRQTLALEPRRFPPVDAALQALAARGQQFEQLKRNGASRQNIRTAECDVFGAEKTVKLSRAAQDGRLGEAVSSCLPAEIQVIAIGDRQFVGWPGEFFVEYGLELKGRAPGTTLITLANGGLQGYIVTPAAVEQSLYEATNALFSHENGQRFVTATLALLATLD